MQEDSPMLESRIDPSLAADGTRRRNRASAFCSPVPRRFGQALAIGLATWSVGLVGGCGAGKATDGPAWGELTADMVQVRRELIAEPWFDHGVNPAGGFYQSMDINWQVTDPTSNFIVFQARQTWAAARLAERLESDASRFGSVAWHGLEHLRSNLWDQALGGFWWLTPQAADPVDGKAGWKMLYGQAFGIYAAAAVYRATGDSRARDLAEAGFQWVERHMTDELAPGYIEVVARDGRPLPATDPPSDDLLGVPIGCKSLNAHLHLMEAYAELYRAVPRADLADRLGELLRIVRDRMCRVPGSAGGLFDRRLNPISQRASYGHDMETAFLIVDTARTLGLDEHAMDKTWQTAEMLVDHATGHGFDARRGAWFDSGPIGAPADQRHTTYWAQAEAMNALAMMHRRRGIGDAVYRRAFVATWRFYREHLLDSRRGGSFEVVRLDQTVPADKTAKATPWKAAYHELRALNHAIAQFSQSR
jgi:mannobiose 2-epimerase